MCRSSTRCLAGSNAVGIELGTDCQMPCIKSVLVVNTDAKSSAFSFQALVAGDYFSSAFPSVSV